MNTYSTSAAPLQASVPRILPSLAPALMISTGFIDLGKWVVTVEGGAHFGFNVVILVLLFNFSAIFCQYLATSIGIVTEKNLAQICSEEYCRPACYLLGIEAEVSLIVSDMTSIVGIAHGMNLLFGLDLFMCILLASAVTIVLLMVDTHLVKHDSQAVYISLAGFVLLFYVLGVLIVQPEVPIMMNGIFPRWNGENSYLIMALLGSNIIVHNFYAQSLMAQKQRRPLDVTVDSLLHDQFFAILFIFSGIFLANCVLMNSATSLFESGGLVLRSFQDVFLLMGQVFSFQIAPIAFLLVLLLSSLITAINWNLGGQAVMDNLFDVKLSSWIHRSYLKALAIPPIVYYSQSAGAEGLYQLLIISQIILALILPSSVIPLFRVASSKLIMGPANMPWYMEILALFAFIWMLAPNIIFIVELLSGNSTWLVNLKSNASVFFPVLLLIGCATIIFTLYLMVTPLKSASDESITQKINWELHNSQRLAAHKFDDLTSSCYNEDKESHAESAEPSPRKTSILDNLDISDPSSDTFHEFCQSTINLNLETSLTSFMSEDVTKVSHRGMSDAIASERTKNSALLDEKDGNAILASQDNEGVWVSDELSVQISASVAVEGSEIPINSKEKVSDTVSGTGSLSRLSGLGRAARRQLTVVLDEFWGHLFDFHGQLTQEASINKVDILLGLDQIIHSSGKTDMSGSELYKKNQSEVDTRHVFPTDLRNYISSSYPRIPTKGSSYGIKTDAPSLFPNTQSFHRYGQSTYGDFPESGERRYSSLHLPQYSDNRDHQPATIHGYQIASGIRDTNARRSDPFGISFDQSATPKPSESYMENYTDSLKHSLRQDRLGSPGIPVTENSTFSTVPRFQADGPYYDSFSSGSYENVVATEKKYHSLPDISGRTFSNRKSALSGVTSQHGSLIGPHPSLGRMAVQNSQCSNLGYRGEGTSLTFDELSPSNYKDVFSLQQPTSNADTKSLWSRQPFEQLFGMTGNSHHEVVGSADRHLETFSYAELETNLLKSLKVCITKLLKLEGSDWLFRDNNGADEEIIDKMALKEKYLDEMEARELSPTCFGAYQPQTDHELKLVHARKEMDLEKKLLMPKCGERCIWRAPLIVSFGVWCIHRILELSLVESRPELWGKYTYVLNRLQGILELAFLKYRSPLSPCHCLEVPAIYRKNLRTPHNGLLEGKGKRETVQCTSSIMVLDIIKDVEVAISSRKGRMGTAAGDVAFPKGKENLASVLKRYKRRLSNKSSGAHSGGLPSRKVPSPAPSFS